MPDFNKNDVYCTECGECDNIRLNLVGYKDGFVDVNCSCVGCGAEWIFVKTRTEETIEADEVGAMEDIIPDLTEKKDEGDKV